MPRKFLKLFVAGAGPFLHRQEMRFADKLTLVTGYSGSGKSTLMHTMKHAIAPNRYAPPQPSLQGTNLRAPEIAIEMEWAAQGPKPAEAASLMFVEIDTLPDVFPKLLHEFSLLGVRIPFPGTFRDLSRYGRRSEFAGDWEFKVDRPSLQSMPSFAFYLSGSDTDFSGHVLNAGFSEVSTLYFGMFLGIRSYLGFQGLPLVLCESLGVLDEMHRAFLFEQLHQCPGQVVVIDTAADWAWDGVNLSGCAKYMLTRGKDGQSRIVPAGDDENGPRIMR